MTDRQSERRRRRTDRRLEIQEAARTLFLERGVHDTSVSAIVRAAGVAQGTFYLYFDSKEHVLARLRGEVLAEYLAAFQRATEGGEPADARLVRGIERLNKLVRKNRDLLRVLRQASTGVDTERVWLEGREALATPLADLIAAGAAEGRFAVDDPRLAAHLVLHLFDDLLYLALEYRRPTSNTQALAHGLRFALRGLGVPGVRVDALVPLKGSRRRWR